ncbi:hypothetical protein EV127DRAFT_435020 [Xylaria flabelliformis]|nr:hypothetical protein EV127DRAFT_435020 [Xylaria flabelliformis]
MGIGMTATARERSGIYKPFADLRAEDASKDNLPWNSIRYEATDSGKIQQSLYKGNVGVLFMSTVYSGAEDYITRLHRRPRTKTARAVFGDLPAMEVALPAIANDYNLHKAGVDTANQLRSYNSWDHRVRKGREQCLFLQFILEVVLTNTFLLQKRSKHLNWKRCKDQYAWRELLLDAIFKQYGFASKTGTRGFSGVNTFKRQPSSHQLVQRGKKSDCKACKGFSMNSQKRTILGEIDGNVGIGKRSTTRYGCKECDVALCNNSYCSDLWHGQN